MKRSIAWLIFTGVAAGCGTAGERSAEPPQPDPATRDATVDAVVTEGASPDDVVGPDSPPDASADAASADAAPDVEVPTSCHFDYEAQFGAAPTPPPLHAATSGAQPDVVRAGNGEIAHDEPDPPGTWQITSPLRNVPPESLTMPSYDDDMPLFDRGAAWAEPTRCYETPAGVKLLSEAEAYDMYKRIAERTTGVAMDTAPEARTVVGLRGAYPGAIAWHGNAPNRFNDTIVLLWIDSSSRKHVREFPVNTDTGARDFGVDSSSSLRANRRYRYVNGWHKTYNALHIDETGYRVRDDTNHNGHWDSDRNGWLPPAAGEDHDRTGSGHNIHMGSVDAPLGTALVDVWSAGCQVIPGMANWVEFITNAWTVEGDKLDYFLIDVRDIPPDVWAPCTPDGSHACPIRIDTLPYAVSGDTSTSGESRFDTYNCSAADESGSEMVYELRVDRTGTLTVTVECTDPVDVDVYLLDGDDARACLARADKTLTYDITPGRYLIVADTYVAGGTVRAGAYNLRVQLQ